MKRHRPGYVNAPQFELPIDTGFNLETQTAPDPERQELTGGKYRCVFIASIFPDSCYQCGRSRAAHQ